jgi:hypothetical protein
VLCSGFPDQVIEALGAFPQTQNLLAARPCWFESGRGHQLQSFSNVQLRVRAMFANWVFGIDPCYLRGMLSRPLDHAEL